MAEALTIQQRVAQMLAENDACGTGPLSASEYLADAAAIVLLVRQHDGLVTGAFEPCECVRWCGDSDPDGPGVCKDLPRAPEPPLVEVVLVARRAHGAPLQRKANGA